MIVVSVDARGGDNSLTERADKHNRAFLVEE